MRNRGLVVSWMGGGGGLGDGGGVGGWGGGLGDGRVTFNAVP